MDPVYSAGLTLWGGGAYAKRNGGTLLTPSRPPFPSRCLEVDQSLGERCSGVWGRGIEVGAF